VYTSRGSRKEGTAATQDGGGSGFHLALINSTDAVTNGSLNSPT
jgi:hypothetical protein